MSLAEYRRLIRPLLPEHLPANALEVYFAFHHPDHKTSLSTYPPPSVAAGVQGYVAVSQTGMDLFRPLVTLRLPLDDMSACLDLLYGALRPETAVFLSAPETHFPLINALFDIQVEDHLHLYVLAPERFTPVINLLVTRTTTANGLPRFVIRTADNQIAASAQLNWQSPRFAELAVYTAAGQRRQGLGRSVVAALAQHVWENGRTPLYAVMADNPSSRQLAESVGFVDTLARTFMIQGQLRPRP